MKGIIIKPSDRNKPLKIGNKYIPLKDKTIKEIIKRIKP